MKISVDRLINDLAALEIPTGLPVWVQVDVDGVSHRLLLGSMQVGIFGLVLVGEPLPVPDPVIPQVDIPGVVQPEHEHSWLQDDVNEAWHCVTPGDCLATVTYEQLVNVPIPANQAEGILLLNSLAEGER